MPLQIEQHNEPAPGLTATIAAAASLSAAVRLPPGHELAAIVMPATWTAANLTFQAAPDGATFANVYDDEGNEATVTGTAGAHIALPRDLLRGATAIKVRSGTSGTAVNQDAERSIGLVTQPA